jgi:hypothetical protein
MNLSESIKTGAGVSIGVVVGIVFLFVILPCGVCGGCGGLGGLGVLSNRLPKTKTSPTSAYDTSSGSSLSEPDPRPTYDVQVEMDDLLRDYKQNKVSADARYKGRNVKVNNAKVDLINTSASSGKPYVTLGSAFGLGGIRCEVSDEASVINLKPGDKITVQGYCEGQIFSSITLRRCFIH